MEHRLSGHQDHQEAPEDSERVLVLPPSPEAPQNGSESPEKHFCRPEVFLQAMQGVIGQEELKPRLAAAFSHYTGFLDDPSVGKPVLLVFGPTGSGKTWAVEMCAKASGLPFTVAGGGGISPAGYKGLTLRDLISQHFLQYRSQAGVIFVDEVDKWCRQAIAQQSPKPDPEHISIGLQKQGEALRYVEHERLVFTEEAKDYAALREGMEEGDETSGEPAEFDTGDTFWIFAGAFVGLDGIVAARTGHDQIRPDDLWKHAEPADFIRYGMMEEFTNRIDLFGWTKRLEPSEILAILETQDRPRWTRLFEMAGIELELSSEALGACANLSWQKKTGPRGAKQWLRHVISEVFTEASRHRVEHVLVDGRVMATGRLDFELA